jgi:hypothetical protein
MSERHHNPYSKYPVIGTSFPVARTVQRKVYLLGKGPELEGLVIRADVQDMNARDDKGQPIPPVVVIPCPRCGKGLRIDGIKKKVVVEYFDKPKPLDLRAVGFGHVEQTGILTVHENMQCSHVNSDAPCGLRFRITENVFHKLG